MFQFIFVIIILLIIIGYYHIRGTASNNSVLGPPDAVLWLERLVFYGTARTNTESP